MVRYRWDERSSINDSLPLYITFILGKGCSPGLTESAVDQSSPSMSSALSQQKANADASEVVKIKAV